VIYAIIVLQLMSMDYPTKPAVSVEEVILNEAKYYIHFLARCSNRDSAGGDDGDSDIINDDDGVSDHNNRVISLHRLLTFPRLQKSCDGDVSLLR